MEVKNMDIFLNEFNHVIIKDKDQNTCELFGGSDKLEEMKEDIKQCQEEGLNCLMCEIGLPITDEHANVEVEMYIPVGTKLLVVRDRRCTKKLFRQYKIQYCPLCGKKLEI